MLQHIVNILSTTSVFFTVSLGLLLILSIMGIVNLAHGAFLTVGGYAAVVVSQYGWNPWLSLAIAPSIGFLLGLITERLIIRRLYARPLDAILATWGLTIVIIQVLSYFFGRSAHFVDQLIQVRPFHLYDAFISPYRLFIMMMALLIGATLALVLRHTNAGNVARAVIMNPALARILGINTNRVNAFTFAFGSALAAFGGALIVPLVSADPNMGTAWLITTFMVALAAGASLLGLFISALLLASAQVLATYYLSPVVGSILILLIPMIVLRFVPGGIGSMLQSK